MPNGDPDELLDRIEDLLRHQMEDDSVSKDAMRWSPDDVDHEEDLEPPIPEWAMRWVREHEQHVGRPAPCPVHRIVYDVDPPQAWHVQLHTSDPGHAGGGWRGASAQLVVFDEPHEFEYVDRLHDEAWRLRANTAQELRSQMAERRAQNQADGE